jgi:hypothetical protein
MSTSVSPSSASQSAGTERPISFSGRYSRLSNGGDSGRVTPVTGNREVNLVMDRITREIRSTSVGRRGLLVADAQSQLDEYSQQIKEKLENARTKIENMRKRPKTSYSNLTAQQRVIDNLTNKLKKYTTAVETVFPIKRSSGNSGNEPKLKRTRSVDDIPTIISEQPTNVRKPTATVPGTKTGFTSFVKPKTKTISTQTDKPKTKTTSTQTVQAVTTRKTTRQLDFNQPGTPADQKIPTLTTPPSQKILHSKAKNIAGVKAAEIRKESRELYGSPTARKRLDVIFNKLSKSPKTPPGITKSNLQQFLVPFKQPISIQFAPSIKATGGKATVIQTKNKINDDKKKKPLKKFDILADPASAYRKSVVASKRKELMSKLRTPTIGQRKKHVIELIDRELRIMKVPKDIQRKMIAMYSKVLSEKQIKQLFGGRSSTDVKKILRKQVEYLKMKKR